MLVCYGRVMNENLENLKKFLYLDTRIKNEMLSMGMVSEESLFTEDAILKYSDNINESLKYVFSSFKKMSSCLGLDNLFLEKIEQLEKITFLKFYDCKLDINKLKSFYQNFVANMDENFVTKVRETCKGYSFEAINMPVENVSSINEMLHIMHSYVLNNENIYQSINVVAKKENVGGYDITLYGDSNELSSSVFNNFPIEMFCGWVDIVSVNNNKVIMMVRDRGHALTIELDKMEKDIRCAYFIPKLCNIEMINMLPGVRKVNENTNIHSGTNGIFYSNSDTFLSDLYTFINMVPTDLDMVYENDSIGRSM